MQPYDGMPTFTGKLCGISALFNADMYSKVALEEHLYDDPDELGEINLPCPVEENGETGRSKKLMFHELEVCSDKTMCNSTRS